MSRTKVQVLIAFLSVALLGSLAANFVGFRACKAFYTRLQVAKLDPLGLLAASNLERKVLSNEATESATLLFFGDSRARQWAAMAPPEGHHCINGGINDQTTEQIAERFKAQILTIHPEFLVIQMGINDLKAIPLLEARKERIVQRCKENIDRILRAALTQECDVILTTVFPLGQLPLSRRLVWSEDVASAIDEVNDYIQSLGAERVHIMDTKKVLAGDDGVIKRGYSRDFLHLNEGAYEALNVELMAMIEEIRLKS